MNKEEFLRGLQNALSGEVPPSVVRDNLRYYDDYIRTELRSGRSEEQIMEELGEPRLIARTIIDTTPEAGEGGFEEYRSFGNFDFGGASGSEGSSCNENKTMQGAYQTGRGKVHYYDLSKWYWKLAGIVILIFIVMFILMLVGGFLSIMIPLLPFILIAMLIAGFFRGPWRW